MRKFSDFRNKCNVRFSFSQRVVVGIIVVILITVIIIGSIFGSDYAKESDEPKDTNVYLDEIVCFANYINIKVVGINVETVSYSEDKQDDENSLPKYVLNLVVEIEHMDNESGRNTKITPDMFKLKSVNLESKNTMVLSIDSGFHKERRIFLIKRP